MKQKHLPIERAIIGLSGFGQICKLSTICLIGLKVLSEKYDELTCHSFLSLMMQSKSAAEFQDVTESSGEF